MLVQGHVRHCHNKSLARNGRASPNINKIIFINPIFLCWLTGPNILIHILVWNIFIFYQNYFLCTEIIILKHSIKLAQKRLITHVNTSGNVEYVFAFTKFWSCFFVHNVRFFAIQKAQYRLIKHSWIEAFYHFNTVFIQ